MFDKLIIAAMSIACAALIGVGVAFALGTFDGSSGLPGSVSDKCQQYALNYAKSAKLNDPFVKGVVTIGINAGPSSPQAAALLKTIGTTYYMPLPYHETAFVCVKPGYEQQWVARMQAMDWVEWAHVQGVEPFLTLGN